MDIRTPFDLGATIRDSRRQLKLTQADLAKRVGVGRQWVIAIENGNSRAELGLVLRTLGALDIRLTIGASDPRPRATKPIVDLDNIVRSSRKSKR